MMLGALTVAFLAFLLWLLASLAIYALPFWLGLGAGTIAYQSGAGIVGAIIVGLIAAALTWGIGQGLFASLRSERSRGLVAVLFAGPAAVAGYLAARGLLTHSIDSDPWLLGLSTLFALASGFICWTRLREDSSSFQADADGSPARSISGSTQPVGPVNTSWPAHRRRR
jgi:hypothetical protein